jgi:hypothetical protein
MAKFVAFLREKGGNNKSLLSTSWSTGLDYCQAIDSVVVTTEQGNENHEVQAQGSPHFLLCYPWRTLWNKAGSCLSYLRPRKTTELKGGRKVNFYNLIVGCPLTCWNTKAKNEGIPEAPAKIL